MVYFTPSRYGAVRTLGTHFCRKMTKQIENKSRWQDRIRRRNQGWVTGSKIRIWKPKSGSDKGSLLRIHIKYRDIIMMWWCVVSLCKCKACQMLWLVELCGWCCAYPGLSFPTAQPRSHGLQPGLISMANYTPFKHLNNNRNRIFSGIINI